MTTVNHSTASPPEEHLGLPRSIPGPPAMPLLGRFGSIYQFGLDSVGRGSELFRRYGKLVALVRGGRTNLLTPGGSPGTILAYGPQLVRAVTTDTEVFQRRTLVGRLYPTEENPSSRRSRLCRFGAGLFAVNGDDHRRMRRLMMPAFGKPAMEGYHETMVKITCDVLNRWTPGQVIDVSLEMQEITKRIVTTTLFGEDIGPEGAGTGQLISESLRLLARPMTRLLPVDRPLFPYRKFLDQLEQIEDRVGAIVVRKRVTPGHSDLLTALMNSVDPETGNTLNNEEILSHAGLLFAAGHETTANALTWTLLVLSQYPAILGDLLDEAQTVCRGEIPSIEMLDQMTFLKHVVMEVLRLIPPAPWNARVTACETVLDGHELPVGTEVLLSIYQTHHMPEIYERPQAFLPVRWERFEPQTIQYCPFGAGPRMCIGATFAMLEIRLILAQILQRWRLEPVAGQRVDRCGHIVLAPRQGWKMIVRRYDRAFDHGVGGIRGNIRQMVELPA